MVSRRRFLQVGLAGATVLAVGGLAGCARKPVEGYRKLDARSAAIVGAIAAVVLDGALPKGAERDAALREVVEAFDRAISALSPAVQEEIDQLLGLLGVAPLRWALTGVASSFDAAPPEDIAAFLQRWRTSRFDLLRAGYQALTQLIQGAWYDNSRAWPAIGYPGPPKAVPA